MLKTIFSANIEAIPGSNITNQDATLMIIAAVVFFAGYFVVVAYSNFKTKRSIR